MKRAQFMPGDRVHYPRKKVRGIVTHVFWDGRECRYYVQAKRDLWSVGESDLRPLQMSLVGENSPEDSHPENDQNDDLPGPKGVGA